MTPTPGPYYIEPTNDPQEVFISTKEKDPDLEYTSWDGLAKVYGADDDLEIGAKKVLANANLLASSWELLEALKDCQGYVLEALKNASYLLVGARTQAEKVKADLKRFSELIERAGGKVE